jgi:hypothetical protein
VNSPETGDRVVGMAKTAELAAVLLTTDQLFDGEKAN